MEIHTIIPNIIVEPEHLMLVGNRSVFSRDEKMIKGVMTKQSRSKYRPHYGAKEAARYAGMGSLGMNTSRAIRADASEFLSPDHRERMGQMVTWTSSNLTKTGEIVAIVPAGERPKNDFTPKVDVSGAPRDHISYVVRANGKHYWPRVSLMKDATHV